MSDLLEQNIQQRDCEKLAISEEEFWCAVKELPPLLRLGFPDGPGALITSEPDTLRRCDITGKDDYAYDVFVVLKDSAGQSKFFRCADPLTVHEFKAMCDRIMPGVGICAWRWGSELLDDNGNLRSDLRFPITRY